MPASPPTRLDRRVLGQRCDLAEQDLVSSEAEDVADAVALQPGHGFVPSIVAVAADQDVDGWPMAADGAHDVAQHQRHLGATWGLARAQDHRDRLAGGGLVDVDRQEAAAVVMGMEQGQLLAAVNPILRIVDVEHDPARHLREAVAEQVHHRGHHPLERGGGGQVLQPAHRRLRAQIRAALGQPADRHLEGRVGPQRVAVVGIRVAGGDHERAKADHLGQAMAHPLGRSRVVDAACQALGDAEPALDLRQHQHPGIRSQPTAVEGGMQHLAGDR